MSATGPSGHAQPLSIEMWFDMHQLLRSCHHRLPICKISSPIWLPLVFSISPVLTCKCGIIHPQPMLTSFFLLSTLYTDSPLVFVMVVGTTVGCWVSHREVIKPSWSRSLHDAEKFCPRDSSHMLQSKCSAVCKDSSELKLYKYTFPWHVDLVLDGETC